VMQKSQSHTGLGAASLVVILLVLCMVLLGVLSLMSARADIRLSERHAQLAKGAAHASADAQRALAALDEQLALAREETMDEAQYSAAAGRIEEAAGAQVCWLDPTHAQIVFDAGYDRRLVVEVERFAWPMSAEKRLSIVRYALEDVYTWEQTESLELMAL